MSAQEAAERLRGAMRPERLLDVVWGDSSAQLRGTVHPPRVFLKLRPARRSFDAVFEGRIVDVPGGCRIVGALRVQSAAYTIGFAILWTVFAVGWSAIVSVAATTSSGSAAPPLPFVILFPSGGVLVVTLGALSRRRSEDVLVRRLDELLGVV